MSAMEYLIIPVISTGYKIGQCPYIPLDEFSCLLKINPSIFPNESGHGHAAAKFMTRRNERSRMRPEPFILRAARCDCRRSFNRTGEVRGFPLLYQLSLHLAILFGGLEVLIQGLSRVYVPRKPPLPQKSIEIGRKGREPNRQRRTRIEQKAKVSKTNEYRRKGL